MAEYSINDLKWTGVLEFKSIGTGKFYKNSRGNMKEELVGIDFVPTVAAGKIPVDKWYQLMELAVEDEGKTELLDKIIAHCQHLAWIRTPKECRQYAMECLSSGAYQWWKDFQL